VFIAVCNVGCEGAPVSLDATGGAPHVLVMSATDGSCELVTASADTRVADAMRNIATGKPKAMPTNDAIKVLIGLFLSFRPLAERFIRTPLPLIKSRLVLIA